MHVLRSKLSRIVLGYAIAVIANGVCLEIRIELDDLLRSFHPYTIFYPAVIAATLMGGVSPGVCALIISAALGDYFFVEPRGTLLFLEPSALGIVLVSVHAVVGAFLIGMTAAVSGANARLRESEERFRILADASPNLIWVTNAKGEVDFVNQRYLEFFGLTAEQVKRAGWHGLVHPDDAPSVVGYQQALQNEKEFRAQIRVRNARGEWRWVDAHAVPRRGAHGEFLGHVGSSPDITDTMQAHAALERTNAELEARVAQRTAELTATVSELETLSYSLAHDLRSPLVAMCGYADLLIENLISGDPETLRFAQRLSIGAQRMDRLIRDVLMYNAVRTATMTLEPVNVRAVVEQLVEEYPALAARRHRITCEGELPLVQANRAALSQALAALLDNAVKFMPPGREPAVVVRCQPVTKPGSAAAVRIEVHDNGIGFDPGQHGRLFQLFSRVHPPSFLRRNRRGAGDGEESRRADGRHRRRQIASLRRQLLLDRARRRRRGLAKLPEERRKGLTEVRDGDDVF